MTETEGTDAPADNDSVPGADIPEPVEEFVDPAQLTPHDRISRIEAIRARCRVLGDDMPKDELQYGLRLMRSDRAFRAAGGGSSTKKAAAAEAKQEAKTKVNSLLGDVL